MDGHNDRWPLDGDIVRLMHKRHNIACVQQFSEAVADYRYYLQLKLIVPPRVSKTQMPQFPLGQTRIPLQLPPGHSQSHPQVLQTQIPRTPRVVPVDPIIVR